MRLTTAGITADMTGPNLTVQSPQYTMAAPRIQMTAKKGGLPVRTKVVEATATGGVRIVIRNPEAKQTTTVTCNRAVYSATTRATDRGRIDLSGNVRSVTQDPSLSQPLINEADTGYINMIDAETTEIVLNEGTTTVTPREQPRKKKPAR